MTLPITTERPPGVTSCSSTTSLWRKPIVWIALGALVLVGLAANLNWLVAAGALPILIGVLPCLAMCALHLCSRQGAETSGEGPSVGGVPPR